MAAIDVETWPWDEGLTTVPGDAFILAALAVVAGYLMFGITGFGASLITVPALAHILPLTIVLPLASLLDLGSALALGLHTRKHAVVRELVLLTPFTLVGLGLGVTLLVSLPRNATLVALGGFVSCYALYAMWGRGPSRPLGRAWAAPAGLAAGVLGSLFGVGGPPYVLYLSGRIADPGPLRATISQMVILSVGQRVAAFAVAGLLAGPAIWIMLGLLAPVAGAGLWVGNRLHRRTPPAALARTVAAVLFLAGAALIVRAL